MPSWNVHLAIGKELAERYDVNKNTFIFASLLPDYKSEIRPEIHFYGNRFYQGYSKARIIDLDRFLETYKDDINNSLILGYYSHILADYFYNTRFFEEKIVHDENGEVVGIKDRNGILSPAYMSNIKESKHSDLEHYGATLYKNGMVELPKIENDVLNSIKLLKNNFFREDEVVKKISYLNTDFIDEYANMGEYEYQLYSKEEYDNLYRDCVQYIIKEFGRLGIKQRS